MRNGLPGVMASQGGVFLRRQALVCGYTSREFDRLIRGNGPFQRIRYGAYTSRELWQDLDDCDRLLLRDRAALLVCDGQTVLSHSSAARAMTLPLHDVGDGLTHVTRLSAGKHSRIESGIKHHRLGVSPVDVCGVLGMRITAKARTVLDISREFGFRSGLVTADGALRAGLRQEELMHAVTAAGSTPHLPALQAVAQQADRRAQTPLETLARILLINMGISDLELQVRIVFPGGGHAEVDIYSPGLRHVFEADGRLKYSPQLDRYGDPVSPDDVVWAEKKREDALRGQGLGVSRVYWSDTVESNFAPASRRLWSEIQAQSRRRAA